MDSTDAPRAIAKAVRKPSTDRQVGQGRRGTSPERILYLIETGGPGGAERMLLDLARHLGEGYCPTIGLLKPGWLQAQVRSTGLCCAMLGGNGLGDLGVIANLCRVVGENQITLIHAHEFYMGAVGALISRLTGVPLVVTVHGKSYYPDKRRRRLIYRMVATRAAMVVAVSQDLKMFFCRTVGVPHKRVAVIHNGIRVNHAFDRNRDPKLLEGLGIPPESSIVGTVGNLYPVKGHRHLILAAKTIVQRQPNTHILIFGRGELKDTLIAEAQALGIKERVHLLGYRDDVPKWLEVMDVFTMPSLSEGLPLSLLEAMAAGTPPVVTSVGGMPEVVQDGRTGFLVPPGDPNSLARKVLGLLEDPSLAANLGKAARATVLERFSLERMVNEYRDLYQAVMPCAS